MKTKHIPSAVPIYIAAAVWIVYGLIFPLYKLSHILIAAAISVAVYFVAGKLFPGQDIEQEPTTGDVTIDEEIRANLEQLKKLKEANAGIASPEMSKQLTRMEKAGLSILKAVADKPARATQVRRFMKYYLPTASKLMEKYKIMYDVDGKGDHITKAMHSVEDSIGLIATAFEKQLDQLYRDEALDMSSDIQVLETMMAGDGLTDEGIKQAVKEDKLQCQTQ